MASRRATIERGLDEIGAGWAVTSRKCILPNDGFDAKPSYHIMHQNSIKRFETLAELRSWIVVVKNFDPIWSDDVDVDEDGTGGDDYASS